MQEMQLNKAVKHKERRNKIFCSMETRISKEGPEILLREVSSYSRQIAPSYRLFL